EYDVQQSGDRMTQALGQTRQDSGRRSPTLEVRPGLQMQPHARERSAELLLGDGAGTHARVLQEPTTRRVAFDDDEVVEVPEHDRRQEPCANLVGVLTESLGRHAVDTGRLEDAARLDTVARDTAGLPQFVQRHPS